MNHQMNPMQPLVLYHGAQPSPAQMQALITCYQPIISTQTMGVYLSLAHTPVNEQGFAPRSTHAQWLEQMDIGMQTFESNRYTLEAIGLLRTFRDRESHEQPHHQTLYYILQAPLTTEQFLNEPALRTLLYHRIGAEHYEQLLATHRQQAPKTEQWDEITLPFDAVFQRQEPVSAPEESPNAPQSAIEADDFSLETFYQFVIADQIDQRELTQALRDEVLATHQVYRLNESQMAKVVKLATNQLTKRIELAQIKELAERLYPPADQSNDDNAPRRYTEEEKQRRAQQIKETYGMLTDEHITIILLCEQMPTQAFLENTKQSINGFVSDNERYYLRDLAERSTLPRPVINFLIYYLLVLHKRENIYKGELQRIANQWQQEGLNQIEDILVYLQQQATLNEVKQTNYRNYPSKHQRRVEPVPDWLNERNDSSGQPVEQPTVNQADADRIRQRIQKLYEQE